ncbi:hypothetical protein L6452_09754 [Arctium lappa]|uniref:Uncharacterized protein n=1 Tax=Arctium lappa TaxID=4217 RepID=A0ACB9DL90_ARCLA|nr:hypothetical protein L6452_09754 [Arctium lappa]
MLPYIHQAAVGVRGLASNPAYWIIVHAGRMIREVIDSSVVHYADTHFPPSQPQQFTLPSLNHLSLSLSRSI